MDLNKLPEGLTYTGRMIPDPREQGAQPVPEVKDAKGNLVLWTEPESESYFDEDSGTNKSRQADSQAKAGWATVDAEGKATPYRTAGEAAQDALFINTSPAFRDDFWNLLKQQAPGVSDDKLVEAIGKSFKPGDFRTSSNAPSAVAQVVANLGGKSTITPEQVAAYNDVATGRSTEGIARKYNDEGLFGTGDLGKFALIAAGAAMSLGAFGAEAAAAEGSSAWTDAMAQQASEINSWMADAATQQAATATSAAETLGGVTTDAMQTVTGQTAGTATEQLGGVSTDAATTVSGNPTYTVADGAAGEAGTLTSQNIPVADGTEGFDLYSDIYADAAAPTTGGDVNFLQQSAAETGVPAGTEAFPSNPGAESIWQPSDSASRLLDGSFGNYQGALAVPVGATFNVPPTGIIDTILKTVKDNPQVAAAAVQAGGQTLAGAFKGDADKELLDAKKQAEIDLAQAKRALVQGGSYFNANLPYKPSGAALRRPDGTPVYNSNGIIGRRLGG
jgi:hypothetical protein